ncbi:MAG: winged helix-turn-helix domain-containing protein [Rhodobacteraceae bacterium]|nr:winged helix-turn-helix domain-containing protein [Paracoccaceae bacterium]
MRILIVEDDETLSDGLAAGLGLNGFLAEVTGTCADADMAFQNGCFAAVVLDVMLPDGSGLDLLTRWRKAGHHIPVILLTALDAVADRIAGLDHGADDYLGKPFDLDELAARLRAIGRRSEGRAEPVMRFGNLELDPAAHTAARGGQQIALSRREYTLLHALMERPGAIIGRPTLEDRLYGWQDGVESNALEVHIHKLRAKLGAGMIRTVRGIGYQLQKDAT